MVKEYDYVVTYYGDNAFYPGHGLAVIDFLNETPKDPGEKIAVRIRGSRRKMSAERGLQLAHALQESRRPVTTLVIEADLRTNFCTAVGTMPFLMELRYYDHKYAAGLRCLSNLLQGARGLESLHWSGTVCGTLRGFKRLAESLSGHPNLKEVVLTAAEHTGEALKKTQLVCTALKSIKNLKTLVLGDYWTASSLPCNEICSHPGITKLSLHGVSSTSNIPVTTKTNQSLKRIELNMKSWQEDVCLRLAEVVKHNDCVHSIEIAFGYFIDIDLYIDEDMQMRFESKKSHHAIHIIEALKKNSSLKHFSVSDWTDSNANSCFSRSILKAFEKMMEHHNMTLQSVELPLIREKFKNWREHASISIEHIKTLALLNKHGRQELLENHNATKEAWVDCLANTSQDLNAVYYLLSKNPSLCCVAPTNNTYPASVSSTGRKRRARGDKKGKCGKAARKK